MWDDEIWDEHRWEAFLRESDRHVDRTMDLVFAFMADHPPPERADAAARRAWEDDLRAYIKRRGWEAEDHVLAFLLSADDEPDDDPDAVPELPAAFDAPAGDDAEDEPARDVRTVPVYQQSLALTTRVLDWANVLPGEEKDSALVQFCSHATQIPANVAKGHGIGYEQDTIGGNIACVKRALSAANAALQGLAELRRAPYMDEGRYLAFYEQTFEVRNALGLYIQALRERFELGID